MRVLQQIMGLIFLLGIYGVSSAQEAYLERLGKYSLMFGVGMTTANSWYQTVLNNNWRDGGEIVYTGEFAYTFDQQHILNRLLFPLFDAMQLAFNFTYRDGWKFKEKVEEFNLYILAKFNRFPWRDYLLTTLAVGEGLSYDTRVCSVDRDRLDIPAQDYNKLLNYLVIDLSFAHPNYAQLELVFRYYHRCSCFGWFAKCNQVGSTGIMVGVRLYF